MFSTYRSRSTRTAVNVKRNGNCPFKMDVCVYCYTYVFLRRTMYNETSLFWYKSVLMNRLNQCPKVFNQGASQAKRLQKLSSECCYKYYTWNESFTKYSNNDARFLAPCIASQEGRYVLPQRIALESNALLSQPIGVELLSTRCFRKQHVAYLGPIQRVAFIFSVLWKEPIPAAFT